MTFRPLIRYICLSTALRNKVADTLFNQEFGFVTSFAFYEVIQDSFVRFKHDTLPLNRSA